MVGLASLLSLPSLEGDLARVEDALRRTVQAGDPFMTTVASHLIPAGGKRLRPALALGVGNLAASPVSDDVVMGGCAVELVHLGSLYHDDVMDEARTRRNVESVNARWGNLVAILAGDFLLARASEIAASLGTEVAGLLAMTIGQLCEGQVRELSQTFDVGRTEDDYLVSIQGKTASLMSTACRIGGITAGLDRPSIDSVTRYGERVGMVFQIVDDILDVVATEEQLGKPAGNDLVEGVYTLPVIRALASADTADTLRRLLRRHIEPDAVAEARALIRSNGAVPAALDVARGYAEQAAEVLDGLDADGPSVAALRSLPHHLV
ncbi:MAG: polyprenyl synthetase family protein, partial [Actinobacteria bacterium]|nr:polyprenyl synthetase family protein [Actinomycetota bacterium]